MSKTNQVRSSMDNFYEPTLKYDCRHDNVLKTGACDICYNRWVCNFSWSSKDGGKFSLCLCKTCAKQLVNGNDVEFCNKTLEIYGNKTNKDYQ